MSTCKYCDQEIEWRESRKTGKPYTVNTDGTFHQCPNYKQNIKANYSNSSTNLEATSEHSKVEVTTAGELLDGKNIDNAKWFIDGLNLRLLGKRIELVVKEKEVSH